MRDSTVRLTEITIQDFKNIREGHMRFFNPRKNYKASILGLYGQNGSGKTALIDALHLLQYALRGKPVPAEMADYIHVDAAFATLQYTFDITVPFGRYEAFYKLKIRKEEDFSEQNIDIENIYNRKSRLVIFDELLSYSFNGQNTRIRKAPFIDTCTERAFIPCSKYERLFGNDKATEMNLLVAKQIASNASRSFIFSRELLNAAKNRHSQSEGDTERNRHMTLLENLIFYGHYELFIINTADTGIISMNALPLTFKYAEQNRSTVGQIMLPLETPAVISQEAVTVAAKVLHSMNIVLTQIVPGLTIGLKALGPQVMENGETGSRIQLMSRKNNKEIPLKYESDGIKKIISVLHLLIAIYNQPSITVAIDELDSGIFEYLLGELLRIISEKGKGQLIFTSHNLRPLETLDRGFIAFTTTNPSKRYIRLAHIKDNNNLRDFYFRDIVLGEQNEEIYEPTNNAEIAFAFREAGEMNGS